MDSVGQVYKTCASVGSLIVLLALSCLTCCAFSCRSSDDSDDDDDEDDDEAVKVVSMVAAMCIALPAICRLRACHGWVLACVFIYSPHVLSCHNHDSGWLLYILRERGGQRALRVYGPLLGRYIPSCADIFYPF